MQPASITPILIGYDPGTTIGCAGVSLTGDVIFQFSMRDSQLSEVVERIILHGAPVCVATDKAKVPQGVTDLARSFGVYVIAPPQDLLTSEKRIEGANAHERDALAAALDARSRSDKLIRKMLKHTEGLSDELCLRFMRGAFKHPHLPMHQLAARLTEPDQEVKEGKKRERSVNILDPEPYLLRIRTLERRIEELESALASTRKNLAYAKSLYSRSIRDEKRTLARENENARDMAFRKRIAQERSALAQALRTKKVRAIGFKGVIVPSINTNGYVRTVIGEFTLFLENDEQIDIDRIVKEYKEKHHGI